MKKSLVLFALLALASCETIPSGKAPVVATLAPSKVSSPSFHPYTKTITLNAPIFLVNQSFDGKFTRYIAGPRLGDGSQKEGQKPFFILRGNSTLCNVIIDRPAADGIHLEGSKSYVHHVEFRDVGEDAITVAEQATGPVRISHCVFANASDKVIQVNSPKAKVRVESCSFFDFTTAIRICGTCGNLPASVVASNNLAVNGRTFLKSTSSKASVSASSTRAFNVSTILDRP